ncbi:hypothetical protein DAT35_06955 [Vitiosangium sp. GDMCC 1.1324]|nr:hypothetical protein DAT35_06955 [Vitiosangium sp. GDMCC 1.1324]
MLRCSTVLLFDIRMRMAYSASCCTNFLSGSFSTMRWIIRWTMLAMSSAPSPVASSRAVAIAASNCAEMTSP